MHGNAQMPLPFLDSNVEREHAHTHPYTLHSSQESEHVNSNIRVQYIDFHGMGVSRPDLSTDGIHYQPPMYRQLVLLLLNALAA
jgi:hypothetical protein